jgi:competence protein ComEC
VLDFGDGVRAEVLHPPLPRLAGTEEDINNNSVVLRLTYGSSSVLLAGDAGCEAEQAIIASGADIRSDVLKVAHHGSRSASGDAWLDAVQPRVAVISVGRGNSFGHPSRIVLDRLSRRHVTVYRTDRNGAVVVRLSPESFRVDPTQSVPQD